MIKFRINFIQLYLCLASLNAQTTEQINKAKEYIKRTGMTESQARSAAKAQGYTDKQINDAIKKNNLDLSQSESNKTSNVRLSP